MYYVIIPSFLSCSQFLLAGHGFACYPSNQGIPLLEATGCSRKSLAISSLIHSTSSQIAEERKPPEEREMKVYGGHTHERETTSTQCHEQSCL